MYTYIAHISNSTKRDPLKNRPDAPSCAVSRNLANRGPLVCRGRIPVSRRRGPWRLRNMPGISTCTNTPLWLRIRSRREAVEARHGQSAAMPCPVRFFLPSNFSSVIMIRNRVSYFFNKSLFFLYLRRRLFNSQSTGLYFVVFLCLLRRGRELAWWGRPVDVISFFVF